jgi:hypothetical protein
VKYFTFYGGDYDSAAWLKQWVAQFWQDEARGQLPIHWAFNPNLSERAPMVFDYIHEFVSDNDFFTAGDTGAGYVIPAALYENCSIRHLPDGSKDWEAYCKYYYDKFDLDITGFIINGHYNMTKEIMKTFAAISPVGNFHNCANTTMALLEIVLSEALDAILKASLVVYDYDYHYYEGQEPTKEIVEIFNGSFEWIDNEEGADNIVIGYNGAIYTLGYEITEEGVKFSLTDDAEELVVELAATQTGDAFTLDLLLKVWGMTYVDGTITASGDEDSVTLAVDIDHLVVNEGYWSTDYIEFEGALQFKLG